MFLCEYKYSYKMAKSFFELPPEIVDLIFNYAAPFKEPKKKNLNQLLVNTTIALLDKKVQHLRNRRTKQLAKAASKYPNFMNDSDGYMSRYFIAGGLTHIFDGDEIQSCFNNLKGCRCCKMHRTNIPRNILGTWDEQPLKVMGPEFGEEELCACKCRHYKRILVKTYEHYQPWLPHPIM